MLGSSVFYYLITPSFQLINKYIIERRKLTMMNLLIEYLITALILITGVAFMCSGAIVYLFPASLVLLSLVGLSKAFVLLRTFFDK